MSELWLFKILTSEAKAKVEAEVKTEARYITGGSIWKSLRKPQVSIKSKSGKKWRMDWPTDQPTEKFL